MKRERERDVLEKERHIEKVRITTTSSVPIKKVALDKVWVKH